MKRDENFRITKIRNFILIKNVSILSPSEFSSLVREEETLLITRSLSLGIFRRVAQFRKKFSPKPVIPDLLVVTRIWLPDRLASH